MYRFCQKGDRVSGAAGQNYVITGGGRRMHWFCEQGDIAARQN